jgi:tetratricopeptide (TPR) repeat protein
MQIGETTRKDPMPADFELKPTTTYDAEVLRTMLRTLRADKPDARTSPPGTDDEPTQNTAFTHDETAPGVEGADVGEVLTEQIIDHADERRTPRASRFASTRVHVVTDRRLANSRPAGHDEEQAAFANELDEHGRAEADRGAYAMARALIEKAVEIRRRLYGERDPRRTRSLSWLGSLALKQGEIEQAQWLFQQALAAAEQQFGPDHPRTAVIVHYLGLVALKQGELDRASDLYDQALAIKLQHLGWEHTTVAATLTCLGNLAARQQNLVAAQQYYKRAQEIYELTLGATNTGLATALIGLGRVYLQLEQWHDARRVLERALRIREALGVHTLTLVGARVLLAQATRHDDPELAHALVSRALRDYESNPHAQPERVATLRLWVERFEQRRKAA